MNNFSKILILQKFLNTKAHMGSCISYSSSHPYIHGFRNKMAILDLEKTLIGLRRACNVIDLIIRSKGHLLFINSKYEYNQIIKETAERSSQSYINNKWIGGFLTNWNHMKIVQNHIEQFSQERARDSYSKGEGHFNYNSINEAMVSQQISNSSLPSFVNDHSAPSSKTDTFRPWKSPIGGTPGQSKLPEWEVPEQDSPSFYTPGFAPRFKKMQSHFEGIHQSMKKKPDLVIIFNPQKNSTALWEANKNQIPIISIVNSNISNELHNLITYPIPANEDGIDFTYLVCNCFMKTILKSLGRTTRSTVGSRGASTTSHPPAAL